MTPDKINGKRLFLPIDRLGPKLDPDLDGKILEKLCDIVDIGNAVWSTLELPPELSRRITKNL